MSSSRDLLEELLAVPVRQPDIEHHQVEGLPADAGGGLGQRRRAGDVEFVPGKDALEQIADNRLVFNDQDFLEGHVSETGGRANSRWVEGE